MIQQFAELGRYFRERAQVADPLEQLAQNPGQKFGRNVLLLIFSENGFERVQPESYDEEHRLRYLYREGPPNKWDKTPTTRMPHAKESSDSKLLSELHTRLARLGDSVRDALKLGETPQRLNLLYAALATIALLLEQGYWTLVRDLPGTNFLQTGLLAIGCFATSSVTGWLAQRVAANERLARQRGRELATQTRVSQLVIGDMHDGVVVLDRDGRVVQHNPQAQRLLAAEPLLGADLPRLLPGFESRWRTWRESQSPSRAAAGEFEVRGRHIGLRLLDTGTEEGFSVLFIEDLARSREQAQQMKLGALGRLTANIAHEIRNPLAAISHAAELLDEEKRTEDRDRLARIIHDNTRRLERLVVDVLQLNRRDRISGERIRLGAWLEAFVDEFVANESVPRERFGLEVKRDASVEFDREHLRQVMWNLLRNAVRYARADPGSVSILLSGYADRVELDIVDDGPGVPAAIQAQLFEPFFTTDSKGTGLGLYLARELCSANQAALEYVADLPGAHFRISMTAVRAA